jgi:hypothetical protein
LNRFVNGSDQWKPQSFRLRVNINIGPDMKSITLAALALAAFTLSAPSISFAEPINNSDGSQTCNASGPSSAGPGICANDLATNEGFCDGGMSSEEGGGTTCSESRRAPKQSVKKTDK